MFPFPQGKIGHYHLVRRIGGGGMGEVYLAEEQRMGITRKGAIKTIRAEINQYPDQAAIRDAERLFRREMQAITTLDHPGILPLYDFGEELIEETLLTYMVMPFRPEGSLASWLHKQEKPLSLEETTHFIGQAAQALQHAHEHGLIHQDVKPANFLLRDRSDQALPDLLLADFGIVKVTTATTTASQSIRGTPAYMAPEQWNGYPVSATDQYALAIMAYLLLTKQYPFKGSMQQVMRQHLDIHPPAPSVFNPALPPDLDLVLLHALRKVPAERFASIAAFANAFWQAAHQPTPRASPAVLPSPAEGVRIPPPSTAAAVPFPSSSVYPGAGSAPIIFPEHEMPVLPPTPVASSISAAGGARE